METTPLKQNNPTIITVGLLTLFLLSLIYIPNIYEEYTTTRALEQAKQEESDQKTQELALLTKEKNDFDALSSEQQQRIIKSIPPAFRQTALMDWFEQLRKGTNIVIGQVRFDTAKTSGSMNAREMTVNIQATDKKQAIAALEFIEKSPLFVTVKNVSLQTNTTFVQADLTLTTYFEK